MKISNRLLAIANLVSKDAYIADIGTDHAYIPVYLLKNGIIKNAICADINKGPLKNAQKEIDNNRLNDKVNLRLGSGLSVLKENEVDEVIIAGMGGILISQILEDFKKIAMSINRLILQPMQAQDELRKYLYNNGYEIIEEKLVKEDFRIYEIIVTRYTGISESIDDIYYEVGKKLLEDKDPLAVEFVDKKINEYQNIINKLDNIDINENMKEKMSFCLNKINKLKEIKKLWMLKI